ncbi:S8 family serine peptidase [Azospirillum brasilense]|nr:S8 family serine peptidase [Azospirillum brasilense]
MRRRPALVRARLHTAEAVAAFLLTVGPASAKDQVTSYLNIQAPTQVAPDLVATVARIGVPESIDLKAGASIQEVVTRRCGGADPLYLKLLLEANSGLDIDDVVELRSSRSVLFPACATLPAARAQPIQSGDSIATIAKASQIPLNLDRIEAAAKRPPSEPSTIKAPPPPTVAMPPGGTNALKTIQYEKTKEIILKTQTGDKASQKYMQELSKNYYSAVNTQAFIDANKASDPRRLQPGQTITLPGAEPTWSTIRLRPGIAPEAAIQAVSDAIAATGVSPADRVEPAKLASLIAPVDKDVDAFCAAPVPPSSSWPLKISELVEVLASNKEEMAQRKVEQKTQKATILILDSGFDFFDNPGMAFSSGYLVRVKGQDLPKGGGPTPANYNGVNLNTKQNTPVSLQGFPDRWHGLGVAGVAVGGRPLEPLRRFAPLPIGVAFANVVRRTENRYEISPDTLFQAVEFAAKNDIPIINVSLSIDQRSAALEMALKRRGEEILLVSAAGNDGRRMEPDALWPAALGGNTENGDGATIVTVGAHDGQGNRATFSRYSAKTVDLLAPGCRVPTYTGEEVDGGKLRIRPASLTGTSFAAPVVSFVAALLHNEGLSVREIKARLLTSVDAHDGFDKVVFSRGVLNATKALAVWHDLVEVRVGDRTKIRLGQVQNKDALLTLCEEDFRLSEVRKLAFTAKDGQPPDLHLWKAGSNPTIPAAMERWNLCPAKDVSNQSITFTDSRTGDTEEIRLSTLVDYVPAWYPR